MLVGAAIGEDAAALDIGADEVLVLASDPVTLAADSLSRYAVLVNANDVATSGATPRWFIATLLFPPGSTARRSCALIADIQAVCARARHRAVRRAHRDHRRRVPAAGGGDDGGHGAPRRAASTSGRMRQGDRILLTKGVAVEGTGLIAREFGERLLAAGMTAAEVAACAAFLDRIGILEEARIARSFAGVTAMHDVTEGGLATAVRELGAAGGRRLRLHLDRIPIYPETARICAILGLDPLGLIGSGSLLITCAPGEAPALAEAVAGGRHRGHRHRRGARRGGGGGGAPRRGAGGAALFERDEVSRWAGAGRLIRAHRVAAFSTPSARCATATTGSSGSGNWSPWPAPGCRTSPSAGWCSASPTRRWPSG